MFAQQFDTAGVTVCITMAYLQPLGPLDKWNSRAFYYYSDLTLS